MEPTSGSRRKKVIWGAAAAVVLLTGILGITIYRAWASPPDISALRRSVKLNIKLADGRESVKWVGPRAPGWVPISQVSNYVLMAFVASEDTSFFHHDGIDLHEIREAIKKDLKEKRFARGASTITQQVVKNVFLSSEKTLWRKIREILWARHLEEELSKREILEFYVNMVELGPGIYGIGQASQHYFGAAPSELGPRQGAFLAMLLPSPRNYYRYFRERELSDWARRRVKRILTVMHRMGFINETEYQEGMSASLWPGEGGGTGEWAETPGESGDELAMPQGAEFPEGGEPGEEPSDPLGEAAPEPPAEPAAEGAEESAPEAIPEPLSGDSGEASEEAEEAPLSEPEAASPGALPL